MLVVADDFDEFKLVTMEHLDAKHCKLVLDLDVHLGICRTEVVHVNADQFEHETAVQKRKAALKNIIPSEK